MFHGQDKISSSEFQDWQDESAFTSENLCFMGDWE